MEIQERILKAIELKNEIRRILIMNILLKSLLNLNKIKFPYLFRHEDIYRIKADKTKLKNMFKKAVKRGIIENIYEDIYKLKLDFIEDVYIVKRNFRRKRRILLMFVESSALARLIDPQCYTGGKLALYERGWLQRHFNQKEFITTGEGREIDACWIWHFKFTNLYNRDIDAGITEEAAYGNKYRLAKPLRALCDYIYMNNLRFSSIKEIKDYFDDIGNYLFDEFDELKKEDFEELQGKFGIKIIEEFLENIRRDLEL
jgi:hypothetical protein